MSNLFRVSAKDHGALILMAALAERYANEEFMSLQGIADEMGLSQGYLEEVAAALKRGELIEGKQGPNGGYRLTRSPKEISVADILAAIEGPVVLVDCQATGVACPVAHKCSTKSVWNSLQRTIEKTLAATTLDSII